MTVNEHGPDYEIQQPTCDNECISGEFTTNKQQYTIIPSLKDHFIGK